MVSGKGIWGIAICCFLFVMFLCIGFSVFHLSQKPVEPTPTIVSLPARWMVHYRFDDGRILGIDMQLGSMGLFNNTGEFIWETHVFAPDYCWAIPVEEEMLMWFLSYGPDKTEVAMLRSDGSVRWQTSLDFCSFNYPGVTSNGNFIFAGADRVICVSGEGETVWTTARPTNEYHSFLLLGETIIAAGSSGNIAGLDLDGGLLWEQDHNMDVFTLTLLKEAGLALAYGAVDQTPYLFAFTNWVKSSGDMNPLQVY